MYLFIYANISQFICLFNKTLNTYKMPGICQTLVPQSKCSTFKKYIFLRICQYCDPRLSRGFDSSALILKMYLDYPG